MYHGRMVRKSLLLLVALLCAESALATRVARLTLSDVRDRSAGIVRGTVVDESVRVTPSMVWTDYTVRVDEVLSGTAVTGNVTISVAGGEAPERPVIVAGAPRLVLGEAYVFFLEPHGRKPLLVPTVGWGQGIYQLVRTSEGREALVSADGEPLEIVAEEKLHRGAAVVVTDGRIEPRERRAIEAHGQRGAAAAQPVARNADGSLVTMVPVQRPSVAAMSAQPRFATMKELREFVRRARAEVQQ